MIALVEIGDFLINPAEIVNAMCENRVGPASNQVVSVVFKNGTSIKIPISWQSFKNRLKGDIISK